MSFRFGTIILFLIFCTSISFGQDKRIELNKLKLSQVNRQNFAIRNPQFKFTISDSWFSRDKVHHFLTSAFLSGVGYYFMYEEQNFSNLKSQQGGFCFSISLGLLKEIRDGFKPKNAFSIKDLVADLLGTIVGLALISDF